MTAVSFSLVLHQRGQLYLKEFPDIFGKMSQGGRKTFHTTSVIQYDAPQKSARLVDYCTVVWIGRTLWLPLKRSFLFLFSLLVAPFCRGGKTPAQASVQILHKHALHFPNVFLHSFPSISCYSNSPFSHRPMVPQLAPPKIPEGERVFFDVSNNSLQYF